jgi:hypothetical protein
MSAVSAGTGLPIRTTLTRARERAPAGAWGYAPRPGSPPPPRGVLRWLAGLDLSAPVTSPRRDLRNGYLVAEMLARLYPVRGPRARAVAGAAAFRGRSRAGRRLRALLAPGRTATRVLTAARRARQIPPPSRATCACARLKMARASVYGATTGSRRAAGEGRPGGASGAWRTAPAGLRRHAAYSRRDCPCPPPRALAACPCPQVLKVAKRRGLDIPESLAEGTMAVRGAGGCRGPAGTPLRRVFSHSTPSSRACCHPLACCLAARGPPAARCNCWRCCTRA